VLSLAGWVNSGIVTITLRDLLDIEHHYPNLMRDIDTAIWQVMLIQRQRETQNG
jgi:hypothetical protein